MFIELIRAAVLSFVLSVSPNSGQAPLQVHAQVQVNGPYQGPVCLVVLQHKEFLAGPFCTEFELNVAEDRVDFADLSITGTKPGEYEFVAVGIDVASEPVTVTILP